jgi:hypothetical protein
MKAVPVAPAPVPPGSAASLLHFFRDAMDRLTLLRLTERDPAMLECIERAHDEILAGGASVLRRMRESGKLENHGLRAVDNRADNPSTPGSR